MNENPTLLILKSLLLEMLRDTNVEMFITSGRNLYQRIYVDHRCVSFKYNEDTKRYDEVLVGKYSGKFEDDENSTVLDTNSMSPTKLSSMLAKYLRTGALPDDTSTKN